MIELNLTATTPEHTLLKDYLQQNASDILADKINNCTHFVKDGITLTNKKNLETFMQYAYDEAKKLAEKGARFACVNKDTVFSWAVHYFEEDTIEGVLYNADGTEYKPKTTNATVSKPTPVAPKPAPQMSLFDILDNAQEQPAETQTAINMTPTVNEKSQTISLEHNTSQLVQVEENHFVDIDGIVYDKELAKLIEMFGGILEVKI